MGGAYIGIPASDPFPGSRDQGGMAPEGSKKFARGSELPVGVRTVWRAGGVAEVSWMVGSNRAPAFAPTLCLPLLVLSARPLRPSSL
jgi:hypothetical protein